MGTLLIAFVGIRLSTPRPTVVTEPGPVRVQVYSPGHPGLTASPQEAAASTSSLGEDLYFRRAGRSGGSPRLTNPTAGSDRTNLSSSKDLAGKSE